MAQRRKERATIQRMFPVMMTAASALTRGLEVVTDSIDGE